MHQIAYLEAWLTDRLHRDERGQGTTEYVLLILGVVLFLVVAALALQGILNGAIDQVSARISQQNAP